MCPWRFWDLPVWGWRDAPQPAGRTQSWPQNCLALQRQSHHSWAWRTFQSRGGRGDCPKPVPRNWLLKCTGGSFHLDPPDSMPLASDGHGSICAATLVAPDLQEVLAVPIPDTDPRCKLDATELPWSSLGDPDIIAKVTHSWKWLQGT